MKGILFRDKENKILVLGWNANPKNYPPSEHFPEGWTWEEVTEKEGAKLVPQDPTIPKKFPDPPEQIIRQLELKHEALIDSLEEIHEKGITLKRGDLKQMIVDKLMPKEN